MKAIPAKKPMKTSKAMKTVKVMKAMKAMKAERKKAMKKEKKTTEFSNNSSRLAASDYHSSCVVNHRRGCSRKPWFFLPKRPADVLQNSPCFCSRHVATKPYSANGQKLITKLKIVDFLQAVYCLKPD